MSRSDHDESAEGQVIRQLDEVTGALDTLSDVLATEESLSVVLQRACEQAVRTIPDADMASVTLMHDDRPLTAAATNGPTTHVDDSQYETGQGPCLEAARTGQTIRADLTEVQQRWPRFADRVRGSGVGSYLSAPLFIDNQYHGSLNLYGTRDHGYRELDAVVLELYTTAAEAAIRAEQRFLKAREKADQLRAALTSRAVIDQAKGVLMGAHAITADEAFTMLVEHSQHENVKLREVAEGLIARVIQPRA